MDLRQATTDDIPGIRRVARRSLSESYDFLDEDVIDRAVGTWYEDDSFGQTIETDYDVILVVTVDDEVVAISESTLLGSDDSTGEIRWIHVAPDYRDRGIASDLYDRTLELLHQQGADRIRALVLEGNEVGVEFYDDRRLERVGERSVQIGGTEYVEVVFESSSHSAPEEAADVERREVDGTTVYVFRDEGQRGSLGRFHPAYRGTDRDDLYAWFCANCQSFDNAVGPMGQIECNNCGNLRKPTRWDAAYL